MKGWRTAHLIKKPKNMLNQLMLSYAVVMLCIIAIFSSAVYYIVRFQITKRVAEANQSVLAQAVAWVDYSMESLENSISSISAEDFVADFSGLNYDNTRNMTVEELAALQEITGQMRSRFMDNSMIQSASLYTYGNRMAITTDGTVLTSRDVEKTGWITELENHTRQDGWYVREQERQDPGEGEEKAEGKERYFSLIRQVPMFTSNPAGAVIVSVPESRIQENILKTMQLDSCTVMIVDRTDRIISHTEPGFTGRDIRDVDQKLAERMYQGRGAFNFMMGPVFRRQAVLVCESKYTGWRYVAMGNRNVLAGGSIWWGAVLWLGTLAMILLCLAVIRRISVKIYSPVQSVANLAAQLKGGKTAEENEMEVIADALQGIDSERNRLNRIFRENKQVMKERFVKNLISGTRMSPQFLSCQGAWLEVELDLPWFAVAVLEIDRYAQFCAQYNVYDRAMMKFGISNITEELFGAAYRCVCCDLGEDRLVAVVNGSGTDMDMPGILAEVRTCVEEYLEISLSAGYSPAARGMESVERACRQAQTAAEERFLLGYGSITGWEPAADQESGAPLNLDVKRISNMLRAGDQKGLRETVREFLDQVKASRGIKPETVWLTVLDLLKRLAEEPGLKAEGVLQAGGDYQRLEVADAVGVWLEGVFEQILAMQSQETEGSGAAKRHMDRAIACINENYDKDISLQWVGEQMGLSPQYISALFRQEYGETFLNYLNKVRIEAAKRLLAGAKESASFQVIGEMVGFNSVHTFMRVFKKYEGITPGKYRDMRSGK